MAEMDEKLRELLGDEKRLKQVLELAQALKGQSTTSAAEPAADTAGRDEPAAEAAAPLGTADILSTLLAGGITGDGQGQGGSQPGQDETQPRQEPAGSGAGGMAGMSGILEALPHLMQAFSGGGDMLPSEKVNLVKAIKPYASTHTDSIDRAIKMAGIAKAAKTALGGFGRPQE